MARLQFSLLIADADDDTRRMNVWTNYDTAATHLIDLAADLEMLWDAVRNVVMGRCVGADIHYHVDIGDWTNQGYNNEADIQEMAQITLGNNSGNRAVVNLPTFDEYWLVNSGAGKVLDVTQASVTNLFTILTEDSANGGINATDSHGVDMSRVISAVQRFAE